MSEANENQAAIGRAHRIIRQEEGKARADQAHDDFQSAVTLAAESGITLRRCTDRHYQLKRDGWTINLYPGNQRIFRNNTDAPFLYVPNPWTLTDAVRAAIAALPPKDQ